MDIAWFVMKRILTIPIFYWIAAFFFWLFLVSVFEPKRSAIWVTELPPRPSPPLRPVVWLSVLAQPLLAVTLWWHCKTHDLDYSANFWDWLLYALVWSVTLLPFASYIISSCRDEGCALLACVSFALLFSWTPYVFGSCVAGSFRMYGIEKETYEGISQASNLWLFVVYGAYVFYCYPAMFLLSGSVLRQDEKCAMEELDRQASHKYQAEEPEREKARIRNLEEQKKKEKEIVAQEWARQKVELAGRGIPIRENELIDLAMFRAAERLFGQIEWVTLPEPPRFIDLIQPSTALVHERFEARSRLVASYSETAWLRECYPKPQLERDCDILYRPDFPFFVADRTGSLADKVKHQSETLAWVLFVMSRTGEILRLRKETQRNIPNDMNDVALLSYLKGFMFADRRESKRKLDEIIDAFEAEPRERTRLELARRMAREHLELQYLKMLKLHGEVVSKEQFQQRIEDELNAQCSKEMIPDKILAISEWLEKCVLADSVRKSRTDGCSFGQEEVEKFINEHMSESRPIQYVREAANLIAARIAEGTKPKPLSFDERRLQILRQREAAFAEYDAVIADPQQRDMAKERFDNRVYLPALEEMAKEKSDSVHEHSTT